VQQFNSVAVSTAFPARLSLTKTCKSYTHVCAVCCIVTTITTTEQMLACEHVIGKCAESDAVVALFLQRRRASDYLVVSYSNRAALTADKMHKYQVRTLEFIAKKTMHIVVRSWVRSTPLYTGIIE
jgi:uncharacterized membrane protein (DUF4010 family)